jgi:hypothetical protein
MRKILAASVAAVALTLSAGASQAAEPGEYQVYRDRYGTNYPGEYGYYRHYRGYRYAPAYSYGPAYGYAPSVGVSIGFGPAYRYPYGYYW